MAKLKYSYECQTKKCPNYPGGNGRPMTDCPHYVGLMVCSNKKYGKEIPEGKAWFREVYDS